MDLQTVIRGRANTPYFSHRMFITTFHWRTSIRQVTGATRTGMPVCWLVMSVAAILAIRLRFYIHEALTVWAAQVDTHTDTQYVKQLHCRLTSATVGSLNMASPSWSFKGQRRQLVTLGHPGITYILNFWHSGTLALSPECQSVGMSEIQNAG